VGIRSDFAYGPDRELVRHQENQPGVGTAVRTIIGDLYEKSVVGSDVEHRYYIRAGGELVAIHKDTSGVLQLRYVHTDHLGSTSVLTRDTDGGIDKQLSFDAWGRRRNPNWTDPPGLYSFAFDGGVGRELSHGFTSPVPEGQRRPLRTGCLTPPEH
jgi:hypothetical protein